MVGKISSKMMFVPTEDRVAYSKPKVLLKTTKSGQREKM
jgi:hypothetical protein